jgi:hypothetical protein
MTLPLQPHNRHALKEWAVIVKALASGRQLLLLRKGGIMENKGGFTVEHAQFFLYPTYVHEQEERIRPEAAMDLKETLRVKPREDRVIFDTYGVAEETVFVNDIKLIERLSPYHILADQEVERRFYYRNRPGLYVLLLRAYRLTEPIELPVTRYYAGCRSWVDLGMDLSTTGCRPVVSNETFDARTQIIRSMINNTIANESKTG